MGFRCVCCSTPWLAWASWIIYFVCLGLLLKRDINAFSVVVAVPAILMLIGITELICERIQKLDWVLP